MSSVSNVVPIAEYFRGNPQALQGLLSEMQSRGLISSDGPALDAFFYLTGLGFQYSSFAS